MRLLMDRNDASRLARQLMNEHGLDQWVFQFDNAKRRFGVCRHTAHVIGLSAPLVALNDEARVRNTILHEIAHALCGPNEGHGYRWRAKAREIGCDGLRCYSGDAVETPQAPWQGVCLACGFSVDRHRLSESAKGAACPRCCHGRFDPAFRLVWTRSTRKGASCPV